MPQPPVVIYDGPPKARLLQQALCTCPWCYLVWEHYETPQQPHEDLRKTRELVGGPHDVWTCPGCQQDSKADILQEKRVRVPKHQERSR